MKDFISKERIFANATKLTEILLASNGYDDFHKRLLDSDINYEENKTYEIAPSGFIDFNQHLYEDINHMNSISTGLYLEKSFVTFRIFIWTSVGEGFEIFKHILRGSEIYDLKDIEDVKEYLFKHLNELESGIIKAYGSDINKAFEEFGKGINNKKLPLPSILSLMTIENNLQDLR
ncbi:MAG: hypothetical protein RSG52_02050 [Terrisporobacter sp.]|uniref:hypothetical protein n=1 Tax=Terrisporobacter sp. TaxID=1965305 RepID=UPI002FC82723